MGNVPVPDQPQGAEDSGRRIVWSVACAARRAPVQSHVAADGSPGGSRLPGRACHRWRICPPYGDRTLHRRAWPPAAIHRMARERRASSDNRRRVQPERPIWLRVVHSRRTGARARYSARRCVGLWRAVSMLCHTCTRRAFQSSSPGRHHASPVPVSDAGRAAPRRRPQPRLPQALHARRERRQKAGA